MLRFSILSQVYCGDVGLGLAAKIANNMLLGKLY